MSEECICLEFDCECIRFLTENPLFSGLFLHCLYDCFFLDCY